MSKRRGSMGWMLCNFTRRRSLKMNCEREEFSSEYKHNNRLPNGRGSEPETEPGASANRFFKAGSYRGWLRRAYLQEPARPPGRFSDAPPALPGSHRKSDPPDPEPQARATLRALEPARRQTTGRLCGGTHPPFPLDGPARSSPPGSLNSLFR